MKSRLSYLFFSLMCLLTYSSCEKVIDLDLNEAAPRLVIEGIVNNRADTQWVRLSRSVEVGEPNQFPGVSGATVMVSDNLGEQYIFRERAPGVYSHRRMKGIPGRSYTLEVEYQGKKYRATSTMPLPVPADSLGVSSTTIFNKERKAVQVLYKDPGGFKNYYRFVLSINKVKVNSIFVFDDAFNDGNIVVRELFDFDSELKSGDAAQIEMQCIDQQVYRYWQGLDQNRSRGGASTTPSNPISNLSNGALGYFSAQTQQVQSLIVP